jgi:hypothetical protein
MTIAELLELAKKLSVEEREELAQLLLTLPDTAPSRAKTGAEIVALLEEIGPIELVDPDIEDPVEWVKAQHRKRQERLAPYRMNNS